MKPPVKILIVRFSSIGDIVLTTPVLRCLKKQLPNCEVHYATKKRFESLLINNPYIDKLHLLEGNLTAFANDLKREDFDVMIDLHRNLRTRFLKSVLRIKSLTFDKINWEKWLMVMFKVNILPYRHVVDRYLETLEPLGVLNDEMGLDYFISANTDVSRFNLPSNYSVYAIGGQHETKKMPLNKQIEMLSIIKTPVVLIGGKEDEKQGQLIQKECRHAINLCGQLSIDESALVMQGAEKVFTHDTGMMHIAAALKKPIVSIWGNTIPDFGMSPYYPKEMALNTSIQVNDLTCRPCSKIGFSECPKKHFKCMQELDFDILK
ncbi:MAG: glycosyltransferase family 9 protein [Bacteroidota bacterium]|nr:glycosyltransferase family 9 protein [Bacteroidota bacterium]